MPRLFDSAKPDSLTSLFKFADRCPPLTYEDERELIAQAKQGDHAAMERIIGSNIGFMYLRAQKAANKVPIEDLMMECCIGCIEAVRTFDPSREVRFITYLELCLRRPIQNAKRRAPVLWSLSVSMRRLAHELEVAERKLAAELGREPNTEELANRVGVTVDKVIDLRHAMTALIPLEQDNAQIGLNDRTRPPIRTLKSDLLPPDEAADAAIMLRNLRFLLGLAMKRVLNERLRDVIRRRYLTHEPESRTVIGRDYGVTRETIRLDELRAISKIKKWLVVNGYSRMLTSYCQALSDRNGTPGFGVIQHNECGLAEDF